MRISIVGAGPAGSYAALLLAKQGHQVQVFEDHPQIGIPVQCTGIVTGALWELIPKEESIIKTVLKKVRVHSPNNTITELPLNEYVLNRAGLDKYIAKLAVKAGAKYHLSHRFVGLQKKSITVRHKGKEKQIPTDIVIGADGVNSEVAKAANIYLPRQVWGGVQATLEGKYESNTFDVYFGSEYKGFFGWAVPESRTKARVGVASQHKARNMFKTLAKKYPGKLVCWSSGPIPVYNKKIPVQKDNVFLVGDAAGLTKATTGGGIITGMISSKILVDSLKNKKNYAKQLKSLRKDLHLHWLTRRILNTFTDKDYNKLIRYMKNPKIHKILNRHHRDFPTRFAFKILIAEPRMLLFAQNYIKQLLLPRNAV